MNTTCEHKWTGPYNAFGLVMRRPECINCGFEKEEFKCACEKPYGDAYEPPLNCMDCGGTIVSRKEVPLRDRYLAP